MTLVIGAFTIGLILSLLSLGVLISFRILRFCDITVDGSITLGAATTAVLLVDGTPPWLATLAGTVSRHGGGIRHRHPAHAFPGAGAAVGHPRDDGVVFNQPARHGPQQRAAARRAQPVGRPRGVADAPGRRP